MTKTILRIDPSSISVSACSEKFRLTNIKGFVPKHLDHKMGYGQSFHKAIAVYYNTGSYEDAIRAGVEYMSTKVETPEADFRTAGHLAMAVKSYLDTYARGDRFIPLKVPSPTGGDILGVELPFMLPYKAYETCDVVLCGVVDALGIWDSKVKVFKDIKTTAAANPTTYLAGYETSPQMMIYSYALKQLGYAEYLPPCVIDGVFINKSGAKFVRTEPMYFREDMVAEYMSWFGEKVDELVACFEGRREWRLNYHECSGKFGACQFYRVCSTRKEYREGMMVSEFDTRIYNPCTFGE